MKTLYLALLFNAVVLALSPLTAITADDLAHFLDVCSWSTIVQSPPTEITVELFRIADGDVKDSVLKGAFYSGCIPADTHIKIIATCGNDPTRIQIWLDDSGARNSPEMTGHIPLYKRSTLPEKIEVGDYILAGEPFSLDRILSKDISDYKSGLLLRIKNKKR